MAVKNSTIIGKLWLNGTNQFQQGIPNPTQASMAKVVKNLAKPQNNNLYNEFIDAYINLVGTQRVHQLEWNNPLEAFIEGADGMYGSSVQESMIQWVEGHTYDDSATDLLKMERPEAQVYYHTIDFQQKYPISFDRLEIMQALRDEYGLNQLMNAILVQPLNRARLDTFYSMVELIAFYENTWGFFKHHLSAVPTDDATGKELLKALRTYGDLLQFPSSLYNSQICDIPVFAKPSELIYITTPEYSASVDVDTLSGVFQLDKAEVKYKKIVIPELPIPNAVGLLTTKDFFVCKKIVDETGSFYDVNTLSTKYIYHLWQIISPSPFVPAILFTTDTATTTPEVTMTATSLSVTATGDLKPGGSVPLTVTLTGTVNPTTTPVVVAPNAATFEITCTRGAAQSATAVALNTRTYVDRLGNLHLQKTGVKKDDVLHLVATSTYVNPSGATTPITANKDITVK